MKSSSTLVAAIAAMLASAGISMPAEPAVPSTAPRKNVKIRNTTNTKHRRGIVGGLYQGQLGGISHSKAAIKKRRAAANRDFNIVANGTAKLVPYNNRAASTGIANAHLGAGKGNRWTGCAVTKRCPGRGLPDKHGKYEHI